MPAMELVGAIGHDHEDPLIAQAAGEEREQVARRPVRPVDVLHDDGHRSPPAETLQQDREAVEQAGLGPFRRRVRRDVAMSVEEFRHEPGQLPGRPIDQAVEDRPVRGPGQAAERLRDRGEWQPLVRAKADAAAFENQVAPLAGSVGELPTSRLLPIPASPPTSTTTGSPPSARPRASSRVAISGTRPIRIGLESRALIALPIIRSATSMSRTARPHRRPRSPQSPWKADSRRTSRGRSPRRPGRTVLGARRGIGRGPSVVRRRRPRRDWRGSAGSSPRPRGRRPGGACQRGGPDPVEGAAVVPGGRLLSIGDERLDGRSRNSAFRGVRRPGGLTLVRPHRSSRLAPGRPRRSDDASQQG